MGSGVGRSFHRTTACSTADDLGPCSGKKLTWPDTSYAKDCFPEYGVRVGPDGNMLLSCCNARQPLELLALSPGCVIPYPPEGSPSVSCSMTSHVPSGEKAPWETHQSMGVALTWLSRNQPGLGKNLLSLLGKCPEDFGRIW